MEKELIPKLRFPEFKGNWVRCNIGEIAKFSKGKGISKANISNNGTLECIRYGELYTIYGETISDAISKTNLDSSNLVLSEKNDVIIPASGETQIDIAKASCVLKSGIALGGDLNIIKTKNSGVFLSYYLNSKKKLEIANLAQGISVVHLYSSQLSKLNLNLPESQEQQKIASFLTSVDIKLQALKKKKELLELYKKGVMQKIFSQELRFKDDNGKEFPDWMEKKVGEIFTFKVTNSYSRENLNYEHGIVKNIHYGDIHTKFNTLFNIEKENVPFINHEISITKISEENYCKKGDIILADASEDLKDVGKCIELININGCKVLSGLHTILARPFPELFAIGFLGYTFSSNKVRTQIQKEAQGSKVLSISVVRLSNIVLEIPSIQEQEKITSILQSIDFKLQHTQRQINFLINWKKGLLQQLFV